MMNKTPFDEKIKEIEQKIKDFKSGLLDFEDMRPNAELALKYRQDFCFPDYFINIGFSSRFRRCISRDTFVKERKQFQEALDNFPDYAKDRIEHLKNELAEVKEERRLFVDEARKEAEIQEAQKHREEDRKAELAMHQQNAQREIQIGNPTQNAPEDQQATDIYPVNEDRQKRQKDRLERLSQLKDKSENLRQELESDWKQRRAEQDSERENLYKFLFDQNGKS